MYTPEQLIHIFNLLMDKDNFIFGLRNREILDYLKVENYNYRKYFKPLKDQFCELYNWDEVRLACKIKQSKFRNKIRNSKVVKYSDKSKEKMRSSQKKYNESIKGTEKELHRKEIARLSLKNTHEKKLAHTPEANKKRIESRKNNGTPWHTSETIKKIGDSNTGKIRSDETRLKQSLLKLGIPRPNAKGLKVSQEVKDKISNTVTYLHRIGTYPLKIKSAGHSEVEQVLIDLDYEVINEHRVGRYSYDIFIPQINTIIEYHGTYWHLDPNKYDINFYDKSKNRYAHEQWTIDDNRKAHAISNSIRYIVIWQAEWESLNKLQKIKKIKSIVEYE